MILDCVEPADISNFKYVCRGVVLVFVEKVSHQIVSYSFKIYLTVIWKYNSMITERKNIIFSKVSH